MGTDRTPALAGITVLEIGAYMAAPFATMQLADLGADVIKVEHVTGATRYGRPGLASHAPLTMWATKEAVRRLRRAAATVPGDDIVARVYGSDDFRAAVRGFRTRQPTTWTGR